MPHVVRLSANEFGNSLSYVTTCAKPFWTNQRFRIHAVRWEKVLMTIKLRVKTYQTHDDFDES